MPTKHANKYMENLQSQFQYNKRQLKILLEHNLISRETFSHVQSELTAAFENASQPDLMQLLAQNPTFLLKKNFKPVLYKELFKYNQILIKLAQQFAKNTRVQQLKLQKTDAATIQKEVALLEDAFAEILKSVTSGYLHGQLRNIDETLLDSGFIKDGQLEFLHNSALHLEIKVQDRKFGEIAIKNNFVTPNVVNNALKEQTHLYLKTKKSHIIGDILVDQEQMSPAIRDEILIIQNRVIEEDWEETLKEVGQSSIEEKEKNALFGALIVKEKLLDEDVVVQALRMQANEAAEAANREFSKNEGRKGPRWIGDILVDEFGLAEKDRKRIIKKQMAYRIERINLKLGINLTNAHVELFNEMEKYFRITYSKWNISAYIELLTPLPSSMTKENIMIWLYHKKISYGRVPGVVEKLIGNQVEPGTPILLAKGDAPVAAKSNAKIHFHILKNDHGHDGAIINGSADLYWGEEKTPVLVKKGAPLITLHRKKGRSGLSVNHCLVAPPLGSFNSFIKGKYVIKDGNDCFFAACDGLPRLSSKKVISVEQKVTIEGDLAPGGSSLAFDCDFVVKGCVQNDVKLCCRSLKADIFRGDVTASESVIISQRTIGGEIHARGAVQLSSVEQSTITGERGITIQLHPDGYDQAFNKIYDGLITSDDVLKISDAKIISSIIRAKNRLILKKVVVGEQCKFVVGDSLEVIALKTEIEMVESEIKVLDGKISILQKSSRELFAKIEKKDIAAIDEEIKVRGKNQRTKMDLDKITELRLIKRKKEKQYIANVDQYGAIFMQSSNQIKALQDKRTQLIEKRSSLESEVTTLYRKDPGTPELDVRKTLLPAGTIIQFRYNQKVLSEDCEGFVFRESLSPETQRYEIKTHRW